MLANEIKIGGVYIAKVSDKLTRVRVDAIDRATYQRPQYHYNGGARFNIRVFYRVTNLTTGRTTTFRSAARFRREAANKNVLPADRIF